MSRYRCGMVSSRAIGRTCVDEVVLIAMTGDARRRFTTFADVVGGAAPAPPLLRGRRAFGVLKASMVVHDGTPFDGRIRA
jgi:hypothetical protein